MAKLDDEARMDIRSLHRHGLSGRDIAQRLGVTEGAVRYHLRRMAAGATDGRSRQPQAAESVAAAIAAWMEHRGERRRNLAELYDWLVSEHQYAGSARSVQRFVRRRYPAPRTRARRRIETPPGAQAQADWAEWPRIWIGGQAVAAYEFHLRLSHSRFGARAWMPRKDQLSWHSAHNETFRRLEGIPATVRVDNEKTAVARGAGPWGTLNRSFERYSRVVGFHIDPCLPRFPEHKAKVERGIGTERGWSEITERDWSSWEELQAWSDRKSLEEADRRICPATGTSVLEAWEAEKQFLQAVPLLPDPFDVSVRREVAIDCTVGFEARRYSVPFRWVGSQVEVRGCARTVQIVTDGGVVAEHRRRTRERIVIDPAHYEGESTDRIAAPMPLGRMGRKLAEIAAMAPESRPLDLYVAMAEAAR